VSQDRGREEEQIKMEAEKLISEKKIGGGSLIGPRFRLGSTLTSGGEAIEPSC